MALRILLCWVSVICSVIGINASGEFTVVHSPNSLRFSGNNRLLESSLKEVYSASLGLSVAENSQWNGLDIADPFNTPEAVVEVYIDGVESLSYSPLKAKSFPLLVDEYEPETFEAMRHRILQRFNNGKNRFVDINTASPDTLASYTHLFGDLSAIKPTKEVYSYLKYNTEEDAQFIKDLKIIKTITAKPLEERDCLAQVWRCLKGSPYYKYVMYFKVSAEAVTPDNVIDFFYFRVSSLHALSDFHGPNSMQVKEAKKLLADALESLSRAFSKVYSGSVLFTIVTTDVAHTRRTIRAAPQLEKSAATASDAYSGDYAAIFNIILWFSVVFVFALLAIVYALADMDPGRDSIIYRMTNIRMKKDN